MSRRHLLIDGDAWRVRAINLPEDSSYAARDERMQRGWLCLERGGEKRRMAPVPESWEAWTEAQLRHAWDIAGSPYTSGDALEFPLKVEVDGLRWAALTPTASAAD